MVAFELNKNNHLVTSTLTNVVNRVSTLLLDAQDLRILPLLDSPVNNFQFSYFATVHILKSSYVYPL